MLLTLDIGNTSVSFGVFDLHINSDKPELVFSSKLSMHKNRSVDEYAVLIKQIISLKCPECLSSINCSAVSSVVPSLTKIISDAASIISGSKPFIIKSGIKTGFKIDINDPSTLGSDIVSNIAGAMKILDKPFVVFDAGTANTVTVVDDSSTVTGTIILPGLRISAEALFNSAELLDTISLESSEIPLIGKNTDQAIRSGLINCNAIMLDGIIRNIRETLIDKNSDKKLGLIATGGFAKMIVSHCRNKFIIDDSLTLRGITELYVLNN